MIYSLHSDLGGGEGNSGFVLEGIVRLKKGGEDAMLEGFKGGGKGIVNVSRKRGGLLERRGSSK